ncbi:hypothetical protein ACH347_44140, partial [Saccharopolyspora sp. 5N102]|uniref:hypothetical protein n=1 Tax=Saccharopolyspora sp. 5N102 TaxID=3375155 RepID=UPI0037894B46
MQIPIRSNDPDNIGTGLLRHGIHLFDRRMLNNTRHHIAVIGFSWRRRVQPESNTPPTAPRRRTHLRTGLAKQFPDGVICNSGLTSKPPRGHRVLGLVGTLQSTSQNPTSHPITQHSAPLGP